jgi:phospholipid/cholesterol/gamma-HCH transport system permease protein
MGRADAAPVRPGTGIGIVARAVFAAPAAIRHFPAMPPLITPYHPLPSLPILASHPMPAASIVSPPSSMPTPTAAPAVVVSGEGDRLALAGSLDIHTLTEAKRALLGLHKKRPPKVLDLSALTSLDTPGALLLCGLRDKGVQLTGASKEQLALLELIGSLDLKPLPKVKALPRWRQLVIGLGKAADEAGHDTIAIITFTGRAIAFTGRALLHPSRLRPAAISRHIAETGVNALPIVGLMAIMISVVIGYQSVAQLRPYGADELTVDLVAVSMLREMGVLVTAIMVAGRSGAAFAAELGVMKAREEVDALKVMGLEPMDMLVVPRLIALVITLPLLAFFADLLGLAGGGVISQVLLGLSPVQYLDRVHHAADLSDLSVGLIKAPVFAVVIAVVGCMHGLRVGGSAESVGQETTRAVVKAIFLVIVLDALFSIVFQKLGL